MICYKDQTFCGSKNCKNKCGRKFTNADKVAVIKIAERLGLDYLPVSMAEFCDEEGNII